MARTSFRRAEFRSALVARTRLGADNAARAPNAGRGGADRIREGPRESRRAFGAAVARAIRFGRP